MENKKLRIGLVVIAYNLVDELRAMLDSCKSKVGHEIDVHIFLHSKHAGVMQVVDQYLWSEKGSVEAYPWQYCHNRGLAKSWNDGYIAAVSEGCDVVLIVNDDVEFDAAPVEPGQEIPLGVHAEYARITWPTKDDGKSDIDRLAEYAYAHQELGMVAATGLHTQYQKWTGMGFSCFALNPIAWRAVGCFDQSFSPIYWEDIDFARRLHLAGVSMGECRETRLIHHGSLTWRSDPLLTAQQNITYPLNQEYYLRKWGGMPGAEAYERPFNANFGLHIVESFRHAPYGAGFDRTDLTEVIKI